MTERTFDPPLKLAMSAWWVTQNFKDGDEQGWVEEFAFLLREQGPKLADLLLDVHEHGFKEPVMLGDDGRLWDGHHRVLIAQLLGIPVFIEATGVQSKRDAEGDDQ